MSSSKESGVSLFGWVFILLLLPVAIFVNGLLLKLMWGWFFVPLGLPLVGTAHALGISLLVGMLTYHGGLSDNKTPGQVLSGMIVRPLVWLALGAIFHHFMVS